MKQEKLKTFIHLLKNVRRPSGQTFDLGLIINEPRSKISARGIFPKIKKEIDIEKIIYDKAAIEENVIDKLVGGFKKNKWIFLEIKKDPSSLLLNQLKHLSNYNFFQLIDYRGQDVFEMKIPDDCRLIVFVERNFIENKITYPHFYRLFGPTLSLE